MEETRYKTFGIAYDKEEEALMAEMSILHSVREYIKTHRKSDGTFVKTLSADFPDVKVMDVSNVVMPPANKVII